MGRPFAVARIASRDASDVRTIMDTMPDLSHLTEDERRAIQHVFERQRLEEEEERQIVEKKKREMEELEKTIQRQRSELNRKSGTDAEAHCNICLKTKFADGIGHTCHYCNIRCCARCGGKVTLRSNKVIWVCILCRKKQELLSKTGQWINQGMSSNDQPRESEMASSLADKRAKLERTQSAAEKENLPLERTGSLLRRQYSHQEQSRVQKENGERYEIDHQEERMVENPNCIRYSRKGDMSGYKSDSYTSDTGLDRLERVPQRAESSIVVYPGTGRRYRRSSRGEHSEIQAHKHMRRDSFSSSDEDMKSVSECASDKSYKSTAVRPITTDDPRKKEEILENVRTFLADSDDQGMNNLQNPVRWVLTKDGGSMIGHMILKKRGWNSGDSNSSAAVLGLLVIGGKCLEDGHIGAVIERVKIGSVADIDGQLKPGDVVLEWNLHSLKGKTYEEVRDIIKESKQEPQVELIVSRKIQPYPYASQSDSNRRGSIDRRDKNKPSVMVTSPGSPDINTINRSRNSQVVRIAGSSSVGGRVLIRLWFDSSSLRLVVTIICANGLVPRANNEPRNPYCKLYLLPDRSEKSKRRTKTLASTNDPQWNQTFVYASIRRSDLKARFLEVSAWDYLRTGRCQNDFLGEARIEIGTAAVNDEAEWVHLGPHQEYRTDYDHFSPPSSSIISRHSDSDTSDFDDQSRRVADGASISSLGSSTSPPPEHEKSDYRTSRRDSLQEYKMPSYKATSLTHYKHQSLERENYSKVPHGSGSTHRSRSTVPVDESPDYHHTRSRSKSPLRMHGRLSPTSHRAQSYGSVYPAPRTQHSSRSATTTPVSSPHRRKLPRLPIENMSASLRERLAKLPDSEMRGIFLKNRPRHTRSNGGRSQYGDLSDSELPRQNRSYSPPGSKDRGYYPPRKEGDIEDSCSVDSSTLSTKSEQQPLRPRVEDYGKRRASSQQSPITMGPDALERCYSHSDVPSDKNIESSLSDLTLNNMSQMMDGQQKGSPQSNERGSLKNIHGNRGGPDSYGMLPKKSNSTSQLSATGRKRRLGFGSSVKSSFTIQRSEEIVPDEVRHLVKQTSSISSDGDLSQEGDRECNDYHERSGPSRRKRSSPSSLTTIVRSQEVNPTLSGSNSSISSDMSRSATNKGDDGEQIQNFIGSLGPGQVVSRQVLGTTCLGEVEMSISLQKGKLEVEVIRGKNFQHPRRNEKKFPIATAKLYLVKGKKCLEKIKVKTSKPSLEPIYQSRILFKENPEGCSLQLAIWGDFGRFDTKRVFMGLAQIELQKLDLHIVNTGWYKLFNSSSLVLGINCP